MEALLALIGLIAGWVLSQLGLSLQSLREQRGRDRAERRQLYARVLAASDACYRTTDLIVNWTRQTEATAAASSQTTRGRQRPRSTANALNETMTELESQLRASRQLFAEVRLIGSDDVIEAAGPLHRPAEEAMLLVRFASGPATTHNRWVALETTWRAARDEFEKVARGDLGTQVIPSDAGWLSWLRR